MSDDLDALLAKLTPEERAHLAARLVAGAASAGNAAATHGTVNVSGDGRINGIAVGINLGTIIYGRDPEEDERRRLAWYLSRLSTNLYRLPLRSLEERLDQGEGMALPHMYVMLALKTTKTLAEGHTFASVKAFFEDIAERRQTANPSDQLFRLLRPYGPDWALPDKAIVDQKMGGTITVSEASVISSISEFRVGRAFLAIEAVQRQQRLVLLGEPGGGKSTFLRHLAWVLAQRGLDQASTDTRLFDWDDDRKLLPIIVPLRALAGRLAQEGCNETTMSATLRAEIQRYDVQRVDDLLSESLHRGVALLLFGGLDEVPLSSLVVSHDALVPLVKLLERATAAQLSAPAQILQDALSDEGGEAA